MHVVDFVFADFFLIKTMQILDFVISGEKLGNTINTPQGSENKKKTNPVFTVDLKKKKLRHS